jgi:hypothetical protein
LLSVEHIQNPGFVNIQFSTDCGLDSIVKQTAPVDDKSEWGIVGFYHSNMQAGEEGFVGQMVEESERFQTDASNAHMVHEDLTHRSRESSVHMGEYLVTRPRMKGCHSTAACMQFYKTIEIRTKVAPCFMPDLGLDHGR